MSAQAQSAILQRSRLTLDVQNISFYKPDFDPALEGRPMGHLLGWNISYHFWWDGVPNGDIISMNDSWKYVHVVVEGNLIYIAVVTDCESVTNGKLS